jgi:WD40 repeat protein
MFTIFAVFESHVFDESGHQGNVSCVQWTPYNQFQLLSGSADKSIRVWDIRMAGALAVLDGSSVQPQRVVAGNGSS